MRGGETETVMLSEAGGCRMKEKRGRCPKTFKLHLAFGWRNDGCSCIRALVCLLRACAFGSVCTPWKNRAKAQRLRWKVTGLPHSHSLFLSPLSLLMPLIIAVWQCRRGRNTGGKDKRQAEENRGEEIVFVTMKQDGENRGDTHTEIEIEGL